MRKNQPQIEFHYHIQIPGESKENAWRLSNDVKTSCYIVI